GRRGWRCGGRGSRRARRRRQGSLLLFLVWRGIGEASEPSHDRVAPLAGPVVVPRRRAHAVEGAVAAVLPRLAPAPVLTGPVGERGEHARADPVDDRGDLVDELLVRRVV